MKNLNQASIVLQLFATLFLLLFATELYSQSLLYKVTGDGMQHPVYVYGTIHALPQIDFFVDDVVMEKFGEAERIVLEIDMSSPTMMAEVQAAMQMTDTTLDQLLTKDEYNMLRQFFADSLQLPLDFLNKVKPLMLSSFMLPLLVGQQPASYEGFFVQMAEEMGKPIVGLETVAEQIEYLDKIPLDDQVEILMESVSDFANSRQEFRRLIEAYKTRDVELVFELILQTSDQYKEFSDYLLVARNKNWIPKIIEFGNSQTTFVAVGCGHLGGEKGVLNLLRKEGLKVGPIE